MYKEKCFVCWSMPIYCNPQENAKGKTQKKAKQQLCTQDPVLLIGLFFFLVFPCVTYLLYLWFSHFAWMYHCLGSQSASVNILLFCPYSPCPFPSWRSRGTIWDCQMPLKQLNISPSHLKRSLLTLTHAYKEYYAPTIQSQYNHNTNTCLQMYVHLRQKCIL